MSVEAKLIISAEDRASAVLDRLSARFAKLGGHFRALDRLASDSAASMRKVAGGVDVFGRLERTQAKLANTLDRLAVSVERLDRAERSRGAGGRARGSGDAPGGAGGGASRHGGGFGGLHVLGLGAGFEAAAAAHEAAKASADRVHEETRMTLAGMSAAEIAQARTAAAQIAGEMPAVGMNELLHEARNARAVVGSNDEALALLPALAKLRVIAQEQKPGQDITQDMDQLIKGLEIKGVTQDPKKFVEYMNGVAKGLSVFGDTLSASQYYQMFLYGRQATPRLSEQFMLGTAPTLAQELKGSSYGRAVAAFNRAIVDGRMTGGAAKELQHLGLIGAGDLDKHGALKRGKSVAGWELAQTDPNAWVRQFLLPALGAHGIGDAASISKVIGEVFSNQLAAQMVSTLATQQGKIDKDLDLLRHAKGLEGADYALHHDPDLAFRALRESLANLGATLGEGTARALAPVAADFAAAIARFSAKVEENNRWRAEHGPDADSPVTKETRRAFNRAVFGLDDDRAYGSIDADTKVEGEFAKRRKLYEKWRAERETDPAKLAAIKERRKHVAPGFEKSAQAQDDELEFPMRAAADKALAALDAEIAAYRASRARSAQALSRLTGAARFLPGGGAEGASPYVNDKPTEAPLGISVFPLSKKWGFGGYSPMGVPPASPSAPAPVAPPPPQQVTVESLLRIGAAEPLKIVVAPAPGFSIKASQVVGLHAEIERFERRGSNVGISLPEAAPNARTGRSRL